MVHVSAAERRPQLISAAIELMAREGAAAGSTRAIAAELGVAQATVHYMFGSKQELYRAVLEELTHALVEQVEQAAPTGASFGETIGAWATKLWQTVRDERQKYLLMLELSILALRDPYLNEVMISHNRNIETVTARLISEAADRAGQGLAQEPRSLARFFLAGFDGITMQYLSDSDDAMADVAIKNNFVATVALAVGRVGSKSA